MKLTLKKRSALTGLAFISVWIAGFAAFTLYPLVYTLYLSFNEVRLTASDGIRTQFVGFDNYRRAFSIDDFASSALSGYISEMLVYVPVITVAALLIALLLNGNYRGVGFFRTAFFLPVIITSGPVISNFIDQGVASLDVGFDVSVLSEYVPQVISDAVVFLTENFIVILWFSGAQILVYLAGLKKIDAYIYEAARIDGAGKWETFWKITLPLLNAMVVVNVVYTVVTQSLFALNPVVIKIGEEMNNVQTGYGYSAALSFIYTAVITVLLALFVLIFMRKDKKIKTYRRAEKRTKFGGEGEYAGN